MTNLDVKAITEMIQTINRKPLGFVLVVDDQQSRVIDYRMMDVDDVLDLLDENGLLRPGGENGEKTL